MGGLIVLGILALIAAVTIIGPQQKERQLAAATQTILAATEEAAAWTPTPSPSPTQEPTATETMVATWTPVVKATATRVVGGAETRAAADATATKSAAAGWGDTTPSAGLGGFGAVSIAVGLTGLMFAVRRLRLRR
jgi:type II secretory pathway pseudopilin PulG